jgi:hypothetical protein
MGHLQELQINDKVKVVKTKNKIDLRCIAVSVYKFVF